MKYMIKRNRSSPVCTWKVNFGGIKKKFHISALNAAERRIGKMSKNKARNESDTSSKKATTLYPIIPVRK
jgi:hypothetical protein